MKRLLLVLAAGAIGVAALVYFSPTTLLFAMRDFKLWRIGFESHEIRIGSHRIHYLAGGEGPPLVLVHGLAMNAKDWSPLLQAFAKGRRVYAIDLLGAGDSDRPPNIDYSVRQHTETLRRFLDAMQIERADVLGVSMGGWVGLRLAAEHPRRVRRLVLVSSAGFDFETDIRESTFAPESVADLQKMSALQTDRPMRLPEFLARDIVRVLREQNPVVRATTKSILSRRDIMEGRVANVRMPVLLVAGTADRIVPFTVAARMKAQLPQATLVPLEGCGHLAIVECKAEALPAITRFLER